MTPNLHLNESSPKFVGCATQPFPDVPEELLNDSNGQLTGTKVSPHWRCEPSQKSLRTTNPIRAIVDPIVSNGIKSGEERGDGKEHISLAVRGTCYTDG
jgi:hypothetical protein